MDKRKIIDIVTSVLTKAPQWIRHDFGAQDLALRTRAEESLAAMISAALASSSN